AGDFKPIDKSKLVGLTCEKYGICELDNVCNPNSPNYDPFQRSAPRFCSEAVNDDVSGTKGGSSHAYYGTELYSSSNDVDGVYAYQTVSTSITLSDSDDILYAPALIPPNYARLEAVANYYYNGSTQRYWKIFSHSATAYGQGSFVWAAQLDATFTNRYVRQNQVTVKMLRTWSSGSQVWDVYLWDWADSEWDICTINAADKTGNSANPNNTGWDMWEEYKMEDNWPSLPTIESYALMVYTDDWYFVTSTYGCEFSSSPLPAGFPSHTMNYTNYWWTVG
ncbi:MAG: hypothetical protein PHY25_04340, partial [Dehalococcoidales bacterium]|nr:hypothetical protein [Dehalococcoidales bacterium]